MRRVVKEGGIQTSLRRRLSEGEGTREVVGALARSRRRAIAGATEDAGKSRGARAKIVISLLVARPRTESANRGGERVWTRPYGPPPRGASWLPPRRLPNTSFGARGRTLAPRCGKRRGRRREKKGRRKERRGKGVGRSAGGIPKTGLDEVKVKVIIEVWKTIVLVSEVGKKEKERKSKNN
jgi:hypothetical protein